MRQVRGAKLVRAYTGIEGGQKYSSYSVTESLEKRKKRKRGRKVQLSNLKNGGLPG